MYKLRTGYIITAIITGFVLLLNFFWTLPDGKLHMIFCSVGQGDAVYVKFPDGRDMLIDGGPNASVLSCLSRHMPFWDRKINIVLLTHPETDHLGGLGEVLRRYDVEYFVQSDIVGSSKKFEELAMVIKEKKIPVEYAMRDDTVRLGTAEMSVLWPSDDFVEKSNALASVWREEGADRDVLGAVAVDNLNDYSVVLHLRYGSFDAILPGDADARVEDEYTSKPLLADDMVEVLKVPHHGSRTGMSANYMTWLYGIRDSFDTQNQPVAVISVGRNAYGHPAQEILGLLQSYGLRVLRTDEKGDIEVVSDGKTWGVVD